MADYVSPEQRRRIAGGLMAAQYDRGYPQLPPDDTFLSGPALKQGPQEMPRNTLADYLKSYGANGLADKFNAAGSGSGLVADAAGGLLNGLIIDPVRGFVNELYNPTRYVDRTDEEKRLTVENSFNTAGAAMMGGIAAPKPRNVVGSAGGDLKGAALGAVPESPGIRAYRGQYDASGVVNRDGMVWASSSPKVADEYALTQAAVNASGEFRPEYSAGLSPRVTPLDFRFNNPLVVDNPQTKRWDSIKFEGSELTTDELAKLARGVGHDGLMIKNITDSTPYVSDTVAALRPGTVYSPLTGDLLYANGGRPGAAAGASLNALTDTPGIRAYHGSPHDFDRFDLSKIGTGEGAQAYGHGLYFAENEGVARSYRERLSNDVLTIDNQHDPNRIASQFMTANGGKKELAAIEIESHIDEITRMPAMLSQVPSIKEYAKQQLAAHESALELVESGTAKQNGRMYEVNIKANPDDFLDWDKPIYEQSDKVKGALAPILPDVTMGDLLAGHGFMRGLTSVLKRENEAINPSLATQRLRDAGIPGIRYLDQGSRSAGQGSSNYVVFDDNLIEILRKYGLLGMAGGAAAAEYSGGNSLLNPSPASPRYRPGDA